MRREDYTTAWQWINATITELVYLFLAYSIVSNLFLRPWALPVCLVYRPTQIVGLLKWGVFTILLIAFTFSAVEFNDKSSYTELHSGSQVRYHAPKDKTARALLKLKRGAIYHIGPGSYENEIVLDEFPKMRFPRKCFIPSGDIEEGERVIYNGTGQECANLQDGEEYHIRVVGNVDRVALDEIPDMWYPENDFARPHGGWDYGDRMKVTYDPDTLKTDEPQNGAKYHIKSVLSGGDELTLGEFPKTDLQSKYFTPCTTSPWFMRFFHDGNFYEGDEVIYNGSLNVHDPIASKLQKGAIYHARVIRDFPDGLLFMGSKGSMG